MPALRATIQNIRAGDAEQTIHLAPGVTFALQGSPLAVGAGVAVRLVSDETGTGGGATIDAQLQSRIFILGIGTNLTTEGVHITGGYTTNEDPDGTGSYTFAGGALALYPISAFYGAGLQVPCRMSFSGGSVSRMFVNATAVTRGTGLVVGGGLIANIPTGASTGGGASGGTIRFADLELREITISGQQVMGGLFSGGNWVFERVMMRSITVTADAAVSGNLQALTDGSGLIGTDRGGIDGALIKTSDSLIIEDSTFVDIHVRALSVQGGLIYNDLGSTAIRNTVFTRCNVSLETVRGPLLVFLMQETGYAPRGLNPQCRPWPLRPYPPHLWHSHYPVSLQQPSCARQPSHQLYTPHL